MLSAQATDASVNKATEPLFKLVDNPAADGEAGRGEAEGIHPHHRPLQHQGQERHPPQPDADRPAWRRGAASTARSCETLPGVGRKTANVVLNVAFAHPTMAVDTHIFRVCNRTGLAPGKTPRAVEDGLEKVVPPERQAPRPSLADPARALCLQGPQARLPGLPDQRHLPLQGEDGRRVVLCRTRASAGTGRGRAARPWTPAFAGVTGERERLAWRHRYCLRHQCTDRATFSVRHSGESRNPGPQGRCLPLAPGPWLSAGLSRPSMSRGIENAARVVEARRDRVARHRSYPLTWRTSPAMTIKSVRPAVIGQTLVGKP